MFDWARLEAWRRGLAVGTALGKMGERAIGAPSPTPDEEGAWRDMLVCAECGAIAAPRKLGGAVRRRETAAYRSSTAAGDGRAPAAGG